MGLRKGLRKSWFFVVESDPTGQRYLFDLFFCQVVACTRVFYGEYQTTVTAASCLPEQWPSRFRRISTVLFDTLTSANTRRGLFHLF